MFENQPVYEGTIGGPIKLSRCFLACFPHSFSDVLSAKSILPAHAGAILLSVVIIAMGEKAEPVTKFINRLKDVVFRLLSIIMETSPIGVMSLMAFSIAQYGTGLFMAIGKYILCCWLACIAVFIIVFLIPVLLYT